MFNPSFQSRCIDHPKTQDASSDLLDPQSSANEASTPPVSSEMSSADLSGLCHDPPAVTLPEIPPGFVPCPSADLRGHRPMRAERVAAREI